MKTKALFLLLFAVAAFLLVISIVSGSQSEAVKVIVNDKEIVFDQPTVIAQGSVLVPLRGVFENLGADVKWDPITKTITATRAETEVILKIGENTAKVNGKEKTLTTPARVVQGRTLVPLRFVSEAMGADVKWNAQSRTVYIVSAAETKPVQNVSPTESPSPAGSPLSNLSGADLIKTKKCLNCHTLNGVGKNYGPPLEQLPTKWDKEKLSLFLLNPKKERTGTIMPSANLKQDEADAIAGYLLSIQKK